MEGEPGELTRNLTVTQEIIITMCPKEFTPTCKIILDQNACFILTANVHVTD